jgi:hypothetical protein
VNLFHASGIAYCVNELAVIECACNSLMNEGFGASAPNEELYAQLLRVLAECLSACQQSDLPECLDRVKATTRRLHKQNVNYSIIANGINTLKEEIVADLRKRKFLRVLQDRSGYVDAASLFGETVDVAFPSASADIKEVVTVWLLSAIRLRCST